MYILPLLSTFKSVGRTTALYEPVPPLSYRQLIPQSTSSAVPVPAISVTVPSEAILRTRKLPISVK